MSDALPLVGPEQEFLTDLLGFRAFMSDCVESTDSGATSDQLGGGGANPTSTLAVVPVPYAEVIPWLLQKHYAHRIPSITYAFGLFSGTVLEGVVCYGTPASSTLLRGVAGDKWATCVIELNRLCVNDGVPKNAASLLVGRSLRQLPKPSIIVSYADTSVGHVGYVYQATNFAYTGLSSKFNDPRVVGLEHQHHATYAHGKSNAELRKEFGDRLYYEQRARKHRYIYVHASKTDRRNIQIAYPALPYPKGESKRYDAGGAVTTQMLLL